MQDQGTGGKRKSSSDGPRLSSVATAIRLLRAFDGNDVEIGVSDLAKRLGIAKSTAHRLASTLVSEGLLGQSAQTGR
ncbi:MAG: MarR family transcriptional regulator, partial [Alphaproteobacteria bacterium]|nr:MarR family transcriptional regulator [Alphaproteobacteria bacterium]